MSYTPPALTNPVTLSPDYTPPDLTLPVVLGTPQTPGGHLQANLLPPSPAITLDAAGQQTLDGQLASILATPRPTLEPNLQGEVGWVGTLVASLPAPSVPAPDPTASLAQDLDLPDTDGARTRAPHQTNMPRLSQAQRLQAQQANAIRVPSRWLHQQALARSGRLTGRYAETRHLRRPLTAPHQHGLALNAAAGWSHTDALRSRERVAARHQQALPANGHARSGWADTIKVRRGWRLAEQQGQFLWRALGIDTRASWPTGAHIRLRWQQADDPAPGYWWPVYQPPGLRVVIPCTGDYTPRPLRCPVILGADYPPQPPCPVEPGDDTLIIPVREEYYVLNTVTLALLDGTPLPAAEFSASIDVDSWTWSWSARLPGNVLPLIAPGNTNRTEIRATLNGEPLRLTVATIQRDRRFGEAWLRVSGRGRADVLAEPVAPVMAYNNASERTAQQCLNDALTTNGVPLGWTLDWQIEDWLVPAGLWSHSGTWISAATRIAEAGGAYVQAHDTNQVLRILPRYPTLPWHWATTTPDIQLPEDVVEVEGIEWLERPDYNGVWIHGGDQGRADQIVRAGSGGNQPAPTVVDTLATDPAMTRQRGAAVLGDTGKQARISLRLPVLPETGLIRPGQFIEYHEQGQSHRGLVRSLSVRHAFPELWQTIGVETHE